MAAGLGFKTFTTGEVLTAADTNGYLMQGVLVFASAAARDAAITSPQEGQFAYLKDTNVTTYYTGSAWSNLDTTGMTNPMTTTGDMVYSSSGSTPARLGIGTTGQVITVAGGIPSWATPSSGGGMTLLSTTAMSGSTSITLSGISGSYKDLVLLINNTTFDTGDSQVVLQFNGGNTANGVGTYKNVVGDFTNSSVKFTLLTDTKNTIAQNYYLLIKNYASTTAFKSFEFSGSAANTSSTEAGCLGGGAARTLSAITSLVITTTNTRNFNAGSLLLYGVS